MEEIKELKENKQKEIDDYKNKLNRANDQIKRLNNEKGDFIQRRKRKFCTISQLNNKLNFPLVKLFLHVGHINCEKILLFKSTFSAKAHKHLK